MRTLGARPIFLLKLVAHVALSQLEKCESESSAVITILCWRISVTHYLWRGAEFTAVISPAPASECQN